MSQGTTNLPPPSYSGPYTASLSVVINAPVEVVWDVLADFTAYPEWNPFVRSQQITDANKKVAEDQTPAAGKHLLMKTHIPPTFEPQASAQEPFELITHFSAEERRMAWKNLMPAWLLRAERWQALSATADGGTLYESREVFAGPSAWMIRWFLSTDLMKGFEAMAEALKKRAEERAGGAEVAK